MAVTIPAFADLRAVAVAALQSSLQATVAGQRVPPDTDAGSVLGALCDGLALLLLAFYRQLAATQSALTLATAAGSDLEALVALLGVVRAPGAQALVPVKFSGGPSGSDIPIPVGRRVLAYDAGGTPTLTFVTVQDATPGVPVGQAGIILAGQTAGWAWVQAALVGVAGNLAAGQIAQVGDPIPGVLAASNPQVAVPTAPTVTNVGTTGSTTYQYALVAHGLTGSTPLSPLGQTTTGNATLTGGNYNALTWTPPADAASIDVLKNTSSPGSPVWELLTTLAGTATSYHDTGAATPTAYALSTLNTTNTGTGGTDAETDTALRARAPQALAVAAKSTVAAVTAAVAGISGVTRVFLVDAVVGGGGPDPGTFEVLVVGSSNPLPSPTQTAISTVIAATEAAGIVGSWSQLTPTPTDIAYTVHFPAGTAVPSTLVPAINAALITAMEALPLSGGVSLLLLGGVIGALVTPLGGTITSLVLTVGMTSYGTGEADQDVPGVDGTLYGPGIITATVVVS